MYSKTFVFSKIGEEKVNTDCLAGEIRFREDVPRAGNYEVLAEFSASGKVMIVTDTGKLVYKRELTGRQKVCCSFSVNVCDIIPKGMTCLYEKRSVDIRIQGKELILYKICLRQVKCPTLYAAGDAGSVQDSADASLEWGRMLPAYVGKGAAVSDHVCAGMTMSTFMAEGHYALIQAHVKLGDYLVLQFSRETADEEETYQTGLLRYIEEIRARGAHPILVTPMKRRKQQNSEERVKADAQICKELGKTYHVPVIDIEDECEEDAYKMAGLIVRKYKHLLQGAKADAYSRLAGILMEHID